MPGTVLHLGAVVNCAHAGVAQPTAPVPRVLVDGRPVTTQSGPYMIAGCPFVPPLAGPCVTAMFTTGAIRVSVNGAPLLLLDSMATCAPTGTPLLIVSTQVRVTAG